MTIQFLHNPKKKTLVIVPCKTYALSCVVHFRDKITGFIKMVLIVVHLVNLFTFYNKTFLKKPFASLKMNLMS